MDNPFDFTGKRIVVTGAAAGIGASIAYRFAEAGGDVCVHYRNSRGEAEALIGSCKDFSGRVFPLKADLSKPEEVRAFFGKVEEELSTVHVLVNNAGIYPVRPFEAMSLEDWRQMVDINLTSPFYCIRECLKLMKREGGGDRAIVNIGSIEAENPGFGHSHYTASKGGLVMFTRAAAKELGPHGIRVNAVSPGLIYKDGLTQAWPEGIEDYLNKVPLGRVGRGKDVANACLFLSSPAAEWISGINLRVDGGMISSRGY